MNFHPETINAVNAYWRTMQDFDYPASLKTASSLIVSDSPTAELHASVLYKAAAHLLAVAERLDADYADRMNPRPEPDRDLWEEPNINAMSPAYAKMLAATRTKTTSVAAN